MAWSRVWGVFGELCQSGFPSQPAALLHGIREVIFSIRHAELHRVISLFTLKYFLCKFGAFSGNVALLISSSKFGGQGAIALAEVRQESETSFAMLLSLWTKLLWGY